MAADDERADDRVRPPLALAGRIEARRDAHRGVDPRLVRYNTYRFVATPVVFGVSIPLGVVSLDLAFLAWLSLFVVVPVIKRRIYVEEREENAARVRRTDEADATEDAEE